MGIKGRLFSTALVALLFAGIIGVLLLIAHIQEQNLEGELSLSSTFLQDTNTLNSLSREYVVNATSSAVQAWVGLQGTMTNLIAVSPYNSLAVSTEKTRLETDLQNLSYTFQTLTSLVGQKQTQQLQSVQASTSSQLFEQINAMSTDALVLTTQNTLAIASLNDQVALAIFACVLILVLFVLAVIGHTTRSLSHPLLQLTKVTRAFAKGDLGRPIDPKILKAHNEIGELSRAFEDMRKNLLVFFQSLEKKVDDNTKALDEKLQETERLNDVMVGRELKMMELKKEIRQLKGEQEV